jgi:hypothetical protein
MCIKLQITSKAAITTTDVAQKMTQVLQSIQDKFGNKIIIKNNKNNTFQQFKFEEPEDFAKNYAIHHFRPSKPQRGPNRAWILFGVQTNQSLSTIQKSLTVATALQHTSSRLVFYPWTENIPDVQSLGFFLGPLPKYQTSEAFEKSLVFIIASRASIPAKRIPSFIEFSRILQHQPRFCSFVTDAKHLQFKWNVATLEPCKKSYAKHSPPKIPRLLSNMCHIMLDTTTSKPLEKQFSNRRPLKKIPALSLFKASTQRTCSNLSPPLKVPQDPLSLRLATA